MLLFLPFSCSSAPRACLLSPLVHQKLTLDDPDIPGAIQVKILWHAAVLVMTS